MKLSDDLTQLTARLMLVQERREAINVAQELFRFKTLRTSRRTL